MHWQQLLPGKKQLFCYIEYEGYEYQVIQEVQMTELEIRQAFPNLEHYEVDLGLHSFYFREKKHGFDGLLPEKQYFNGVILV